MTLYNFSSTAIPLEFWDCPGNTQWQTLPLSHFSTILFVIDIQVCPGFLSATWSSYLFYLGQLQLFHSSSSWYNECRLSRKSGNQYRGFCSQSRRIVWRLQTRWVRNAKTGSVSDMNIFSSSRHVRPCSNTGDGRSAGYLFRRGILAASFPSDVHIRSHHTWIAFASHSKVDRTPAIPRGVDECVLLSACRGISIVSFSLNYGSELPLIKSIPVWHPLSNIRCQRFIACGFGNTQFMLRLC